MSHLEKKLGGALRFQGKIVDVWHDQVELENGKTALREVIRHPGAVGVLVREGDSLVLVRQYRYAVGQELLEICAGKLEPGEAPEPAALRELAEETGIVADELIYLGDYYASPGIFSEIIHLYFARPKAQRSPSPDEDEFVTAVRVDIPAFEVALARGEVPDGKTMAAYTLARSRGLLECMPDNCQL